MKATVAGVVILSVSVICTAARSQDADSERVPLERAPEISAVDWFNAQPVYLHIAPQAVLLEFWSVSSGNCRKLVKPLNRLHREYDDGRLKILALSDDNSEEIGRAIRQLGIRYQVGAESNSASIYEVRELPTVVLVDMRERGVYWRAEGNAVTSESVRKAVESLLGPSDAASLSMQRTNAERADPRAATARAEIAEAQLASITSNILDGDSAGIPIESLEIDGIDAFYDDYLPSEFGVQTSPSEDVARNLALGFDGKSGYGQLLASGRLTDSARSAIRDRLLSMTRDDPSVMIRMNAAGTLRRFFSEDDVDRAFVDELRAIGGRESDAYVRGAINQACDSLDSTMSARDRAQLARPQAIRLRRLLNEAPDPASSPWSDAYAYMSSVSNRTPSQLAEDYWKFPDANDEAQRDNAALKRFASINEIENRIGIGIGGEREIVQHNLMKLLPSEPDASIRRSAVSALAKLAEGGGDSDRQRILSALETQLTADPDVYLTRPRIDEAIIRLRARP